MPKLQPAVMQIYMKTGQSAATANTDWVDLSQMATIVNRRFYRQGLQWAVSGMTVTMDSVGANTGEFRVETLPSTWVMSNAWHKAFAAWKKQQDETLDEADAESTVAKFRDFKIFMDSAHVADYVAAPDLNQVNAMPRNEVAEFNGGEWVPSEIVLPNTSVDASGSEVNPTTRLLHAVGVVGTAAPDTSRGLLAGYAFSRAVPQSPDPAVDARVDSSINPEYNWLRQMVDDGNANLDILQNAVNNNDELPYDQLEYPNTGLNAGGLQLVHKRFITANASSAAFTNHMNFGGFVAPCGLIKITNTAGVTGHVIFHLTPGKHRGYLAEPMQDM